MRTSEQGRIFDVRRFSTHDGGGIRTTVFFKGCPLRCAWCHNPEGIPAGRQVVWFAGSCIGCRSCADAAVQGGIVWLDGGIRIQQKAAEDWDRIMDVCPTGALRWDSRDVSCDELLEEIRRDKPFFVHGGGGVTLSGGDPLMQAAFAAELLRRCREEGIHTAVETELHAPWEDAQNLLEQADLIYADLKLMDAQMHRRWTGVGNEQILANFRMLLAGEMRSRLVVRTPMIPGITATEENIASIARFLSELYPGVRLELLNYNPLAAAKYPLAGRTYELDTTLKSYSEEEMEGFRELARRNGVKHILRE